MTFDAPLTIRQRYQADFQRPQYHFLPPSNWMNDPNGVIHWQGQYHLFYQYNPFGPLWGNMHWGHATSPDLIHWTDLPIALAPTPGGPDEAGVFSGCAIMHDNAAVIFYTGTRGERNEIQTQCMATSRDGLLTWEKYAGNPILRDVPPEARQNRDFRDPFVWREGDDWYMVIGSRIQDVGGAVFLYRSTNLIDWEYLHPLMVGDIQRNGTIWECPNFFPMGNQWVLIISSHTGTATHQVLYFVGRYENQRFTPTSEGVLDYDRLYAPLTMLDEHNQRILFGWVRESRSNDAQQAAGWSGVQSIPRLLSLDDQHRLKMLPVPAVETLRGEQHHYEARDLNHEMTLDVRGLALDIEAEFLLQNGGTCGLSLACAADGAERVDIVYEAAAQELVVRVVSPQPEDSAVMRVPHPVSTAEPLKLRILLDGSVVEIIANGRTSLTSRVYPSRPDCHGVRLMGTQAHLERLDIWNMSSIWQSRQS